MAEDEASLYLQATTQRVWAPKGQTPVIRVHPGRECTHFFGTLDLRTGAEIALRTDSMNAAATAQHLQQVLNAFPDVPILLLWDKAPWHQGEPIRKLLSDHPRLEIMCFPTASPDLNPQEHVWKAVAVPSVTTIANSNSTLWLTLSGSQLACLRTFADSTDFSAFCLST